MFENLTIVAIIMIVAWVGLILFYIRTSGQQAKLQEELDALEAMLADEGNDSMSSR